MKITISEAAQDFIRQQIAKQNGLAFKISVKPTGCSGYAYLPEVIKQIDSNDLAVDIHNNFIIYIDSKWINLLQGILIDYVEDAALGLKQKKLVFLNPKEKNRCGCGESFHI